RFVGGKEQLERELRQRDVDRRAENRGGGEEGKKAKRGAPPERHRDSLFERRVVRLGRGIGQKLAAQRHKFGIGGHVDLLFHPRQDVLAPLGKIVDAR